jgi:hypothetical protein
MTRWLQLCPELGLFYYSYTFPLGMVFISGTMCGEQPLLISVLA